MTDSYNEFFAPSSAQQTYNAAQAAADASFINGIRGGVSGPYSASSGSSGGYTDKELFAMQAALNEAAKVKQEALTKIGTRTDQTVTGNIDYFKQLTEAATQMMAPYQAMATQGQQFYLNAIGANGRAAQQATLPQASDIFKQNSIDATNFLSSIPNWSYNQAANQSSGFMNDIFGYSEPAQKTKNKSYSDALAEIYRNSNTNQPQYTQQQQPAPASASTQAYTKPDYLKTSTELAADKAAADVRAKAQSDYETKLADLTSKQSSYQQDVKNYFDERSKNFTYFNDLSNNLRLGQYDNGWGRTVNDSMLSGLNAIGYQGPNRYIAGATILKDDLHKAGQLAGEKAQQYAMGNAGTMRQDTSIPAGYYDALMNMQRGKDVVNPYDQQIADLKAQYAASQPKPAVTQQGQVAPQGGMAQILSQIPARAATLNAPQQSAAPNRALQGLMTPFMNELNNRPEMDPNNILNSLIDPATGAVNNWINSGVVKDVMDATLKSGTNAVQNAAAARGMLDSGQTLSELNKVGVNAAGQYIVPYAGQLANTVLNQGANLANSRMSNYYNLLGKGADFANSMMQTQAAMTQGLAGQYNSLAGNTLSNLQNNSSKQAIEQGSQQLMGAMNLMNQGQQAAQTTANAYGNLASQAAVQNIYGNEIYGNNQLQSANIEANRISQFNQLQMQMDRLEAQKKASDFGMMFNGGGSLLGLGMMALGGGL